MISLVYISSTVGLLRRDELLSILEKSRENNAKHQVTGLLAYLDGNVMQVLEGPEAGVMEIFHKIEKDTRHRNVTVLLTAEIDERHFPDWRMAFVDMNDEKFIENPAFSAFLNEPFTSEKYKNSPSFAMAMLVSFKESLT
jgi:hypothetical protein